MKIVIELSEEDYNDITLTGENTINLGALLALRKAVRNGTSLPEHHGRLIDADALVQELSVVSSRPVKSQLYILNDAPTIIEGSDKE